MFKDLKNNYKNNIEDLVQVFFLGVLSFRGKCLQYTQY